MSITTNKRIVYIDLMRAFAVIMMIQGHTIDTLLAIEYRTMDSLAYSFWFTLRGFTAPIFMFTAGLIFTYLLKAEEFEFLSNPRIKKGVKRALTLIFIGYLLRYPTYSIFDFSNVTQYQWNVFFTVDALHLIGFGLLSIILAVFLAKRMYLDLNSILSLSIILLFLISPVIDKVEWNNYLPRYISAYLSVKNGSFFPLFPWLIYVLSGALLGNYLQNNEGVYFKKRFSFSLLSIGGILLSISFLLYSLKGILDAEINFWLNMNGKILLRIGYVILLNGLMAFIVRKFNSIPKIIKDTGKKTLMLYVIHLVILYGCAWFPGLDRFWGKSLNGWETIAAAIIMVSLMVGIVIFTEKYNYLFNRKFILNKT